MHDLLINGINIGNTSVSCPASRGFQNQYTDEVGLTDFFGLTVMIGVRAFPR